MIEQVPKDVLMAAKHRHRYFDDSSKLKNIKNLFKKPLHKILKEKYRYDDQSAKSLASFVYSCVRIRPTSRSSLYALMNNPWLRDDSAPLSLMTQEEWKVYLNRKDTQSPSVSLDAVNSRSELSNADEEDNPETRLDFNFEDSINRRQELFFNPNTYRFEEIKKYCERSFVNPNVPVGYDEGIDIGTMDRPEYYEQFRDLGE